MKLSETCAAENHHKDLNNSIDTHPKDIKFHPRLRGWIYTSWLPSVWCKWSDSRNFRDMCCRHVSTWNLPMSPHSTDRCDSCNRSRLELRFGSKNRIFFCGPGRTSLPMESESSRIGQTQVSSTDEWGRGMISHRRSFIHINEFWSKYYQDWWSFCVTVTEASSCICFQSRFSTPTLLWFLAWTRDIRAPLGGRPTSLSLVMWSWSWKGVEEEC